MSIDFLKIPSSWIDTKSKHTVSFTFANVLSNLSDWFVLLGRDEFATFCDIDIDEGAQKGLCAAAHKLLYSTKILFHFF